VLTAYVTGLLTGLSLIVAIGAQNAYVLRQGLRREHVGVVVMICAVSDLLLIAAGTLGIGTLVRYVPWLLVALTWGGVAYLLWFAYRSFRSAMHPEALSMGEDAGRRSIIATALALTYLNPHVYLDTVVLIGSVAAQYAPLARAWFTAGACLASLVWFTSIGYGARLLAPLFDRPVAWRVLDIVIAVVMFSIAASLVWGQIG